MTRKLGIFVCVYGATLLVAANPARAAEVIDRIVATVNGHIILQSDWDDALSYEALIGGKLRKDLTTGDRKAALNRLVDQELLREQMRPADLRYSGEDQAVASRVQDLRKQYLEANSEPGWHDLLARYDLTEDEVRDRVAMQLDVLHLVEDRLLPALQVDEKSVQDYYNQSVLPQLRQSGAKEVALADVAPKIKELLTQQKLNESLVEWLQGLRESSIIRLETPVADGGPAR